MLSLIKKTKVNYSLLQFTIFKTMVLLNFDLLWKTLVLWKKKNYGTMDKPMTLYQKLWNFDLRRKNT